MAVYRWSLLANNQTISPFNRASDVLRFDDASISASAVVVTALGSMIRFTFGGKGVTLNMPFFAETTSNVTFDNGSQLIIGDNLTSTGFDNTGGEITGGPGNDQLVAGAGGYDLFGGAGNDLLIGGTDNDLLDGQSGSDTLRGGGGDDIYMVDSSGDVIFENAGQGTDIVISTAASYQLNVNLESLDLVGAAITGAGNNLNNIINGNANANTLSGAGGNDDLTGFDGNDMLIGGAGADVLDGGEGFDYARYDASTIGITIDLTGEQPSTGEAAGDEWGSVEGILATNFNDRIFGDAEHNSIVGLNGNDTIDGGTGDDYLNGYNGDDVLEGGIGWDRLAGHAGNDTFRFDTEHTHGDTVLDFAGNGALAGDQIVFTGYGSATDGATFIQLDATHWQVTSVGGDLQEIITFSNAPSIHSTDYMFI